MIKEENLLWEAMAQKNEKKNREVAAVYQLLQQQWGRKGGKK